MSDSESSDSEEHYNLRPKRKAKNQVQKSNFLNLGDERQESFAKSFNMTDFMGGKEVDGRKS